jgi:hypothetical protein
VFKDKDAGIKSVANKRLVMFDLKRKRKYQSRLSKLNRN